MPAERGQTAGLLRSNSTHFIPFSDLAALANRDPYWEFFFHISNIPTSNIPNVIKLLPSKYTAAHNATLLDFRSSYIIKTPTVAKKINHHRMVQYSTHRQGVVLHTGL